MQVLGEPRREGGGVRAVLVAALDGVVGNEPGVAPAAAVGAARAPPGDVRSVLVLDADAAAIERRPSRRREVEDELVAVVQEARAVDRLVVTDRQVALQARGEAGRVLVDGDRLDPVDGVLQVEALPRRLGDVHRRPGIGGLGAEVQEQRAFRLQHARRSRRPGFGPLQVFRTRKAVVVRAVFDAEVVGRRRDDDGDRTRGQRSENVQAICLVERQGRTSGANGGVNGRRRGARAGTGHGAPVYCVA